MEEIGSVETLRQALTLWERVGMPARNLSLRTRTEYTNDLTDLITYLEQQGIVPLARVTFQHLTNYQAEMDKRGYKPSTRNRKTHAIKSWFKFLHNQGVIRRKCRRAPDPAAGEQARTTLFVGGRVPALAARM